MQGWFRKIFISSSSVAKFFKIPNVFMLEKGIVDEEARETLSKLCRKKGICELLELECKIPFSFWHYDD